MSKIIAIIIVIIWLLGFLFFIGNLGEEDAFNKLCKEQIVNNMITPSCKEWLEQ